MLLKARIYRFFAACFAFVGLVIFIFMYIRHIDGRVAEALSSPFTIVVIVFPFLPAAVLSLLSMKAENKFFKILQDDGSGKSGESDKKP